MSLHDRIAVQIAEQENDCEDATEDREHCRERERESHIASLDYELTIFAEVNKN